MKQLFSSAGRVSESGGHGGGVSVSVAVHAVAIGAVLVFSGTHVVSEVDPPLYHPPVPVVSLAIAKVPEPAAGPPQPPRKPIVNRERTSTESLRIATPPPPPSPETNTNPMPPISDLDPTQTSGPGIVCPHCLPSPGTPGGGGGEGLSTGGDSGSPVRVSVVNAPIKIHDVQPQYPEAARRMGIEGMVILDCVIAPNGTVREVRTLSGNPLFYQAARDAVGQWRYSPPRLNNQPVAVLLTVTLRFKLNR